MAKANKNGLPPFDEFYAANKHMIFSAIKKAAPTLINDEDAKQLALIAFWQSYETYDGRAAFSSLFYAAVRRRLAWYVGKQYAEHRFGTVQDVSYEALAIGDGSHNDKGVEAGSSDLDYLDIEALLRPLTPQEREFCRLRYQGLTLREIAGKFGISGQRVSAVLAKAENKIKKYLEE